MKTCFKCGLLKPIDQFYKNKGMPDGTINKCKDCARKDSIEYRNKNIEKVRAYDKVRGLSSHRIEARKEYKKNMLENNPEKWREMRKHAIKNYRKKIEKSTLQPVKLGMQLVQVNCKK